jgi:hypothetical protein
LSQRLAPWVLGISCCALVTSAALAQIAPGDTGAGVQRGLQQMNNSGEPGTVTLFSRKHGTETLVVIQVATEATGRTRPASIRRGKDCTDVAAQPAYPLAPVVDRTSRTLVEAPESKLLSGNYVLVVHAADNHLEQFTACGQLYQS